MNRLVAIAILAAVFALQPGAAAAQPKSSAAAGERVDGDLKGTVGLGLIGMELGLLMPPALNLHDAAWAWVLFPVVGAAGGAVAGVFAFEGSDPNPKVTVPILAVGLGLIIPAVVGSLAIKSRREIREVEAGFDAGDGLVRLSPRGTAVRVPGLTVESRSNAAEAVRYGARVQRSTALHMPLLSGRF